MSRLSSTIKESVCWIYSSNSSPSKSRITASIQQDASLKLISTPKTHRPPSAAVVEHSISQLRKLVFPGYFGEREWTLENMEYQVGLLVEDLRKDLTSEIASCLHYSAPERPTDHAACLELGASIAEHFLSKIPKIREKLYEDVHEVMQGDPAVTITDEVVFAYPGIYTIFVYRSAHILQKKGVPILPRMMTEVAHGKTGIDIHPGAKIGRSFFIDHGTGLVIGSTCIIGNHVRLYQGVTLGSLSFPKDSEGNIIKGLKRHPTLEDNVTIFANATVLGGKTVIGHGSIIGGGVFVTKSVPAGHVVRAQPPELKMYSAHPKPVSTVETTHLPATETEERPPTKEEVALHTLLAKSVLDFDWGI